MADPATPAATETGVVSGGRKLTRFNVSTTPDSSGSGAQLAGLVEAARLSAAADRSGPNGGPAPGNGMTTSPSLNDSINRDTSRFRIESVDEDEQTGTGSNKSDEVPDGNDGDTAPTNGGGGGPYSYDTTQGQKTFGRNTLETLPHVDHYRNWLSTTGTTRKRPTLLELHEQDMTVSRLAGC